MILTPDVGGKWLAMLGILEDSPIAGEDVGKVSATDGKMGGEGFVNDGGCVGDMIGGREGVGDIEFVSEGERSVAGKYHQPQNRSQKVSTAIKYIKKVLKVT
ncbi:hypothetical protein COLO4_32131 [Corchorus olitorius]|uniref:Uncharacterized protein n=1 Tax=Corchorus olitorius TaxID=93759 RepID=A0A1R3H1A7_9ROSI|nr:hypothetical protein COLO4_32131 [Corchorus olitorius]